MTPGTKPQLIKMPQMQKMRMIAKSSILSQEFTNVSYERN